MQKLSPVHVATALALTAGATHVVCALAFVLWPGATLDFFNAWFHGLDLLTLQSEAGKANTLAAFLYGLAGIAATGFFTGALFAFIYNFLGSIFCRSET